MIVRNLAVIFLACSSILLPQGIQASSHSESDSGDWSNNPAACGCNECTEDVLNQVAGEYTCAERISYLMEGPYKLPEKEACIRISRTEYRYICGPECDPGRCDGRTIPEEEMPSSYCGCNLCTHEIWNRRVDGHTCGARISFLTDFDSFPMTDACNIVGGHEYPDDDACGLCDPERCNAVHGPGETHCGCSRCVDSVWNLDADGTTCGERIENIQKETPELYPTELEACRFVAGEQFPNICGSNCNPDMCDAPLRARTPLHCFPDFGERVRLRNMWGNHSVEVKESRVEEDGVCGPHDNKFTANTVKKLNKNEVKLLFKRVENEWEGSEIRIRMPNEDMPFRYGTYSFSVKSVRVVDGKTGEVESTTLPPSIVLGMHSYDATENFAVKENFNHQVGMDISRFDGAGLTPDARYAVQPAIDFNTYTFFTGLSSNYQQSPMQHSFEWRPAEIGFHSSNGESSESFTYSTQRAVDVGEHDYTQCLPADVEIRISLWNLYGTNPPTDMDDDHVVEVVIDDFSYRPSGLYFVPDGGTCSKDCHCKPASKCYSNRCTEVVTHYEIASSSANASGSSSAGFSSSAWRSIVGLTVFSCSVSALALVAYQATKMRYQAKQETFTFILSPGAVKG